MNRSGRCVCGLASGSVLLSLQPLLLSSLFLLTPLSHCLFNGQFVVYTFLFFPTCLMLYLSIFVSDKHTFLVSVLFCISCFVPFQNTHFLVMSLCICFVFPLCPADLFNSAAAY